VNGQDAGSEGRPRSEGRVSGSSPSRVSVHDLPIEASATIPPIDLVSLIERAWLIALGSVSIGSEAIGRFVERTARPERLDRGEASADPLPGAVIGLSLEAAGFAMRTTLNGSRSLIGIITRRAGSMRDPVRSMLDRLAAAERRYRVTRDAAEGAAEEFADVLVREISVAIVDRLDLTELIVQGVDLNRIVESLDLRALAERLPIEDLAGRVDVDAVAARLDVDALIRRIDLARIATQVIDDIDLPEIIRESTGELSTEAVDALRSRTMHADRRLVSWRRQLLGHRDGAGGPISSSGSGGDT
jgi:hypothetical protein